MKRTILGASSILAIAGATSATNYYADAAFGSDAAPGTLSQPFKTLEKCVSSLHSAGDICNLRTGTYLTNAKEPASMPSGTVGNPITVQGYNNEHAVIRQGSTLTWTHVTGNLWTAPFDYNALIASQRAQTNYFERGIRLWNDGEPLPEASFPYNGVATNFHGIDTAGPGSNRTLITNAKISGAWNLKGGRAVVSAREHLTMHSVPIISSSLGQVVIPSDYPWSVGPNTWFYLEGSKDLIVEPWDWAADGATKLIWLQTDGSDPNQLPIRVQTSSAAFYLKNVSNWAIHDLEFQGVVPVPRGTMSRIQYHHLTIREAGILRFNEGLWDYKQLAGLVMGDDSRIHHSVIEGCDGRCVAMNGVRDTVDNNVFRNGTRQGQREGTVAILKANAVVVRNDIFNSGTDGITTMTTATDNLLVRRNWITRSGIMSADASGIKITRHGGISTLDSNLVAGSLQGAGGPVAGSIGGTGIFLDEASAYNDVLHNVFTDQGAGVVLNILAQFNITTSLNNHIARNTGVNLGTFANFRQVRDLSGSYLVDNIPAAPLTNGIYTSYPVTGSPETLGSLMSIGLGYVGNLDVGRDPMLTDPAGLNFMPRAGSPAIDYGVLYPNVRFYYGSAPDAGAVESTSKPWTFGLFDDPVIVPCSPALCFEDASLWTVSWNGPAVTKANALDRVQGFASMSLVPNDYIALETPNLAQSAAKGFNMLQITMKYSTMANPWYYGSIQFYFDVPSLGIYNQWVGQFDLTGRPLGIWDTMVMPIPTWLGSQLAGKTFSDLKVRMAVNIPAGSGPVLFDYLRLLP